MVYQDFNWYNHFMNQLDNFNPFSHNIDHTVKSKQGKDSVVSPFAGIDKVLKWNHKPKKQTSNPEHLNRLLYKKKKYEMLRFFLADFIPDSSFVLGHKPSFFGKKFNKNRTKEYTVQAKVPDIKIYSLP